MRPPLALVLESARSFLSRIAGAYSLAFVGLFAQMRKDGSNRVPLADFWFRALALVHGTQSNKILHPIIHETQAKWAAVLDVRNDERSIERQSSTLAPRVQEAFAAPNAAWSLARMHSPDLMIAASSLEAIANRDYLAVLGEIHITLNTLEQNLFLAQHPARGEHLAALLSLSAGPRIMRVPTRGSKVSGVRAAASFVTPNTFEIESGFERSALSNDRVLRIGELFVEQNRDGLMVRNEQRTIDLPILELLGETIGARVMNDLDFGPKHARDPRITIDRLVIRRESLAIFGFGNRFCVRNRGGAGVRCGAALGPGQ